MAEENQNQKAPWDDGFRRVAPRDGGDAGSAPRGPRSGRPFGDRILAVQFHPETFTQAGDTTFLRIFQDLVRRAR